MYDEGMEKLLHPEIAYKTMKFDNTKDLTCGMPLKAGGVADTAHYNGKLYGFCSKECKDEFEKNPAAYLAKK
jgi:YHS domain-containing protein